MNTIGLPSHVPVLIAVGIATQRSDDPRESVEPIDLMTRAVQEAASETGLLNILQQVDRIYVPHGRWGYEDPGGMIAAAVGASHARSVFAKVGILQQSLIGRACERIARGEDQVSLVVGGDTGHRLLRSQILKLQLDEKQATTTPDEIWAPHESLRAPSELAAGLQMPVGLYAMLESALRNALGRGVEEHRDEVANLYASFSKVAAQNRHAWNRTFFDAGDIRNASDRNAMQAFPYTKRHCTTWSVDQASALLFMSAAKAEEFGVPRELWIFPLASTESNHMQTVSSRRQLERSTGARLAGHAALEAAGLSAADLDHLDLYSCFPVAVEIVAQELGLGLDRQLTITGGMAFAGGPYNNYVLHSTAQMARLLRSQPKSTGLVGCISGILTKQAFGIWGQAQGKHEFSLVDVSEAVARIESPLEVVDEFSGVGRVVGFTVVYRKGADPRGIAILDIANGKRSVAYTDDPSLTGAMESQELVGGEVHVANNIILAINGNVR